MPRQEPASSPALRSQEGIPRHQILVLGMHRSGTSMVTEVLVNLGIHVGASDELVGASIHNPRGYFERKDLRSVCDRLLSAAGADWWRVLGFDPARISERDLLTQGNIFASIASRLDLHGTWAIKEPRLCLILPILRPYLAAPVVVHVYRNPVEVARSLNQRNQFPIQAGLALWEAYNTSALSGASDIPRVFVSYQRFLDDPVKETSFLHSALAAVGVPNLILPESDKIAFTVDRNLRRQRDAGNELERLATPSQNELWHALLRSDGAERQLSFDARSVLETFEWGELERARLQETAKTVRGKQALAAQIESLTQRMESLTEGIAGITRRLQEAELQWATASKRIHALTKDLDRRNASYNAILRKRLQKVYSTTRSSLLGVYSGRLRKLKGSTLKPENGQREKSPPLINWVIGPEDNYGWAYGNNARRLSSELGSYRHVINSVEEADVAIFFDPLVAHRFPSRAQMRIVRIGGPRPLDRLYGDDIERMRAGLQSFDAVITLNRELTRRVSQAHPDVHLVPNGLDLSVWQPRASRNTNSPFVAGFAGSIKSASERDVKGFDIACEAAKRAGIQLRCAHKGNSQIPHEEMLAEFYGKIDVLVLPVAAGREGTSNVIMEALAVGLPVVTTRDAGFHSEQLVHGRNVLFVQRDPDEIATVLDMLRRDCVLRGTLSAEARRFALENHSLEKVAQSYDIIIRDALCFSRAAKRTASFIPFWKPAEQFGSSRLRALYPVKLLNARTATVNANVDEQVTEAQIHVVVQSAEDRIITDLNIRSSSFVVYDCCDRYFESDRSLLFKTPTGEVNSLVRFQELAKRADALIAPTLELKAEFASRFPNKPCFYIPEPIDYDQALFPPTQASERIAVWFGNPHRGNFASSKWVIDLLWRDFGYHPRIISRRSFFKQYPEYKPYCIDWQPDNFPQELRRGEICIVSHSSNENTKSPNRLVTAAAHGVPTIVTNSAICAEILETAGCGYAVVSSREDVERAVGILQDPQQRSAYVRQVQDLVERRFGVAAVRRAYLDLFVRKSVHAMTRRLRVAFVTHNLKRGEGAPKSLFELASGLHIQGSVEPYVYSPSSGDLRNDYEQIGIPVYCFSGKAENPQKLINRAFKDVQQHFTAFLRRHRIDVAVVNTIRATPFAAFAHRCGIPSIIIVRESFDIEERFRTFNSAAKSAAECSLVNASTIVFVSPHTQQLWRNQPMCADVRVIPNGISHRAFVRDLALTRQDARRLLDLPDDQVVALCVGTINVRKGQLELLEWIQQLPNDIKSLLTVMFVGATKSRTLDPFRQKLAEMSPIYDKVRVVEVTPEVGLYYRAADLLLVNSKSESYPRSVMEALLFKLPVLCTPAFGILDQITNGENGFIYEYADCERWTNYLSILVRDENVRKRMSETAGRSFWKLTTYAEMLHCYRCIINQAFQSA